MSSLYLDLIRLTSSTLAGNVEEGTTKGEETRHEGQERTEVRAEGAEEEERQERRQERWKECTHDKRP